MTKPKLWFQFSPAPDARSQLEPVAEIIENGPMDQLPGATGMILGNTLITDGALMDEVGDSLRVIARPGIGVDNIVLADATERGIAVINTPDAPTESTAEHAVALLMSIAKRTVAGSRQLQGQAVERAAMRGTELRGRTLGVVGFGRIGRRVAEICGLGLRMNVVVHDPFAAEAIDATGYTTREDDLDALFAQADFVTLHCPLMDETRGLANAERLALMKPGSYLINAARGPVVDEAALLDALQSGHLAGAAIDVFDPEPPLPDNPLLQMDNVVATPHISSFTDMGQHLMQTGVTQQLLQILRGERPDHLVNPGAWPGRNG